MGSPLEWPLLLREGERMPCLFELIANDQRQNQAKLDRQQAALDEVKSISERWPQESGQDAKLVRDCLKDLD
jgi:hypothetical protein